MKNFDAKARNFVILMAAAFVLLFLDLFLWLNKMETFSETIWGVNQVTISLAFGVGVVCGHLFTVPKD